MTKPGFKKTMQLLCNIHANFLCIHFVIENHMIYFKLIIHKEYTEIN